MDPLSFTASIMTVSGVVAASTKIIYNLRDKFKDAPEDIESLMEQLQAFKDLLKELEAQVQDHQNIIPPQQTLQKLLANTTPQRQPDVHAGPKQVSRQLEGDDLSLAIGERAVLTGPTCHDHARQGWQRVGPGEIPLGRMVMRSVGDSPEHAHLGFR